MWSAREPLNSTRAWRVKAIQKSLSNHTSLSDVKHPFVVDHEYTIHSRYRMGMEVLMSCQSQSNDHGRYDWGYYCFAPRVKEQASLLAPYVSVPFLLLHFLYMKCIEAHSCEIRKKNYI